VRVGALGGLSTQAVLFLEGYAGVGKTEVAKSFAAPIDARLIRLQCCEGIDVP
jgi:MoxR-like ATPase